MIRTNKGRQRDSIYQIQCGVEEKIHSSEGLLSIFEKCTRQIRQTKSGVENDEPHTEMGGPHSIFSC